jgi:hypothetical protein
MGRLTLRIGAEEFDLGNVTKATQEPSGNYVKLDIEFFERVGVDDEISGSLAVIAETALGLPIYVAALKAIRTAV